jgi:hypothetical protein
MTDIAKVAKEVSKRTNIDKEIVEDVCKFAFLFTTDVMKDEQDVHDILFNKLFKFKLKTRYKQNKRKEYSAS